MSGWLCAHTQLSNGWKRLRGFFVVAFFFKLLYSSSFVVVLCSSGTLSSICGALLLEWLGFFFLLLGRCEGPSLFDITTLIRLRSFIFILFWDEDLMGVRICVRVCVCLSVSDYVCAFMMSGARMLGNMAWPGECKLKAKHRPKQYVCGWSREAVITNMPPHIKYTIVYWSCQCIGVWNLYEMVSVGPFVRVLGEHTPSTDASEMYECIVVGRERSVRLFLPEKKGSFPHRPRLQSHFVHHTLIL